MSTYSRYIIKSFFSHFFVVLLIFVFLMFSIRVIPIIELILIHNASLKLTLLLLVLMIPDMIVFILPATFLSASLLTFYNVVDSNENISLMSCGMNEFSIVRPVFIAALVTLIFYLPITFFLAPLSNKAFNKVLFRIVQFHPTINLKPMVFTEPFQNITIYVNEISSGDGSLNDVLVMDKRDPNTTLIITAKKAFSISPEDERFCLLEFIGGRATVIPKQGVPRNLSFERYSLMVELEDILGADHTRAEKPKEMTLQELLIELNAPNLSQLRKNDILFSFYNRFMAPLSSIIMVLLAGILPLKVHFKQRSNAFITGLFIFFGYYLVYTFMKSVAKSGNIRVELCALLPVIFLLILFALIARRGKIRSSVKMGLA